MIKQLLNSDNSSIALMAFYCFIMMVLSFTFFATEYGAMKPESSHAEMTLLKLIVVIGVFASAARAIADLLADIKEARLNLIRRQSLTYLLRPLQGGAAAMVVYFAVRACLLIFDQGWPAINPWGFFAIAAIAGITAPQVLDKFGKTLRATHLTERRVSTHQITQTLEHIVAQILKSDASIQQKQQACKAMKLFLQQPLTHALFANATDDLLLFLSWQLENQLTTQSAKLTTDGPLAATPSAQSNV